MDSICEKTKSFWKEASDGGLPLPFAAWLTNAACEATKSLCAAADDIVKDAQELQLIYYGVVNTLGIMFKSCPIESKYTEFTQGRGMTFPWLALLNLRNQWKERDGSFDRNDRQDPTQYISPEYTSDNLGKDLDAYNFMLATVGQLLRKEKQGDGEPGFNPGDMNPLYSDISAYLESNTEHEEPKVSLVFGVQLLLETYRSFIWRSDTTTKTNCRLKALRFAKEVQDTIGMPMLTTRDQMVSTIQLVDKLYLDSYLSEERFDLYYQSPWTAGYHMSEILHHAIDAGLRLCNSEGFVGAVLHIYNALRQLKAIDAVPLLEDLCKLFLRQIFLGSLPVANFSSHFRRFLGGTVQMETSQTSPNTRKGRRSIGLPRRLPSSNDYTKRLMPGEMSLFYELHNQRFATTIDFWARLYTNKRV